MTIRAAKKWLVLTQISVFLLNVFAVSGAARSESDYDNNMAVAQGCFSQSGKSRNVIHCLARIEGYTDPNASELKCAIRIRDQGFDFFNYPWYLNNTAEYLWVVVLKAISDRDLDRGYAAIIRTDCNRTGKSLPSLLGDYYYLRALVLEISVLDAATIKSAFQAIRSVEDLSELGNLVALIAERCERMPDDALWKFKLTNMCSEAIKLWQYPGETAIEKFIHGLLVSS